MKADHQLLLEDALAREAEAHRLLLAGGRGHAKEALREASELYRRSWEASPPRAFGRLVGMLKASILAGEPGAAAAYVRRELDGRTDSPTSAYALAIAALVIGDDEEARRLAAAMKAGGDGFERAAEAIEALADRDADRYRAAIEAIVADFAARENHLTGVPIADTALMLEVLAERRGLAAHPTSPLLPPG